MGIVLTKKLRVIFRIYLLMVLATSSTFCVGGDYFSNVSPVTTMQININAKNSVYQNMMAIDSCNAYFNSSQQHGHICHFGEVPPQVAIWLFMLAILGFIGFLNRRKL